MPFPIAWAVAAIGSALLSSYEQKRANDKQQAIIDAQLKQQQYVKDHYTTAEANNIGESWFPGLYSGQTNSAVQKWFGGGNGLSTPMQSLGTPTPAPAQGTPANPTLGTPTPAPAQGTPANPIPRASGGVVEPGKTYVVGENQPETLTMGTNGTGVVVPTTIGTTTTFSPGNGVATSGTTGSGTQANGNRYDDNSIGGDVNGGYSTSNLATSSVNTQGAINGATASNAHGPTAGDYSVYWLEQFLKNPGTVSPISYERAQEQANLALNQALSGIQGGLSGRGVDANSNLGQALAQNAYATNAYQRNNAARDMTQLEEAMKREDIKMALATYMNILQMQNTYQAQRMAALNGAIPQGTTLSNPYSGLTNLLGTMTYAFGGSGGAGSAGTAGTAGSTGVQA